jgi:hypothetical protein
MANAPATYRIVRRSPKLFFLCIACGHEIEVGGRLKGEPSPRSQAAAAMMLHQQTHKTSYLVKASR